MTTTELYSFGHGSHTPTAAAMSAQLSTHQGTVKSVQQQILDCVIIVNGNGSCLTPRTTDIETWFVYSCILISLGVFESHLQQCVCIHRHMMSKCVNTMVRKEGLKAACRGVCLVTEVCEKHAKSAVKVVQLAAKHTISWLPQPSHYNVPYYITVKPHTSRVHSCSVNRWRIYSRILHPTK